MKNKINISKLKIENGYISYYYLPTKAREHKNIHLKKELNIRSDFIDLKNIDFIYSKASFDKPSLKINKIKLKLRNLLVKTSQGSPLSRSISFSSPEFSSSEINIFLKKRSYSCMIGSMDLSYKNRVGNLTDITYAPKNSLVKSNYTLIKIKKISISEPDVFSIPGRGIVEIKEMRIEDPEFRIYHSRGNVKKKIRRRSFPHEFIKKIKFGLAIF